MSEFKNASDLIDAIDCNRHGFKRRIVELQNKYFHNDIIDNSNNIISSPIRDKIIVGYLTSTVVGFKGVGKSNCW